MLYEVWINPSLLLEKTRLCCVLIFTHTKHIPTYPQLTSHNIFPSGLYEAHRLGQSQLFTPRVYESGNSPDLRDRHHIHQMVTSASSTSGSSRPSDQVGVHRHQWNSWVSKKRKLRGCVFPHSEGSFMHPHLLFVSHFILYILLCPIGDGVLHISVSELSFAKFAKFRSQNIYV